MRVLIVILTFLFTPTTQAQYSRYDITTVSGNLSFAHNQTPETLVPVSPLLMFATYRWEQSTAPLTGFTLISGATAASYTFSAPLLQTTYFRRIATMPNGDRYSRTLKIEVVSVNWENRNYVREHDVLVPGQTDWKAIDQLPIGQKMQTTTYMDGLGRVEQTVSRETATPADPNNPASLWGDVVQFSVYDVYGRQPKQYLPYTTSTTTESGKHKAAPEPAQELYYTNNYNETSPYSTATYDLSPLNRVLNAKAPGTAWAASAGNGAAYDLNDAADNVQQWTIGYDPGDAPVRAGTYADKTLFKTISTDVNGKQSVSYTDKSGQLILSKTQIADAPSAAHDGWICTYNVYDDFGLLRYVLQPEAVKYLDTHSWLFSGTDGQQVLDELCFRYEYDAQGRTVRKKAPGAKELRMLYDSRDRVVFMQDGNQRAKTTPEWTANIYDELDRVKLVTLYQTTSTVSTLQTAINNAGLITTTTTTIPAQPITNQSVSERPVSNPTPPVLYTARESIEFVGEFTSIGSTDEFIAEIDPNAAVPAAVTTNTVYKNPISNSELNNPAVTTILKYLYYDDYNYTSAKQFNTAFENTQAYTTGEPIVTTARTTNLPTGVKVRVLGTNTFLSSTMYYDEDELPIQVVEDNIKNGVDITTNQFQWDGRLLSSHTRHTAGGTGYSNFTILTKNVYDKIGRVTALQKKWGGSAFKTIARYDLDDMGRLKTKQLDPNYTGPGAQAGGGLESMAYSYNIHDEITGINKDYALKTPGLYDKWGHYFGLYLGYDNRDNVFAGAQLDGHVTGLLWNTMGDDAQRKYDYTYDHAGRLVKALFHEKQEPLAAWDNTKMDFTVGGNSGRIAYDLNGNLVNMLQRGVQIGNIAPITVDNLQYEYASYSNKLKKVTDNGNAGTANGQFGDFKDGSNGAADDYVYDDNGNLVIDLNKNAKDHPNLPLGYGIKYNFLDKPEEIRIAGRGTIKIVYDADATKLQKIFTTEGSTPTTKITTYINSFVYEEKSTKTGATLQFINFEEGRLRVMQPVSEGNGYDVVQIDGNLPLPDSKKGVYDYFIRDYQQNVRMILTEGTHLGSNKCSMETERVGQEEPVFGQTGTGNEVALTRTATPPGWPSNGTAQVSKLSSVTHKVGPNSLLKVMAGDELTALVNYYYQNPVTNSAGGPTLAGSVISTLISAITSTSPAGTVLHNGASNVGNNLLNLSPIALLTDPDAGNPNGDKPKAYLTVLFFDERMNLIEEGSASDRVKNPGDGQQPLSLLNIKAPKNGYAYIYVSNESAEPVYFDNLQIADNRGRIVEENHYYAYGLKIAAISSTKLPDDREGHVGNANLYNDKELFEDADLDWYDYGFRNYDPQIGRFTQLDPLTDDYPYYTPYQYAGCEPIANIDLDGLEPLSSTGVDAVCKGLAKVGNTSSNIAAKTIFSFFSGVVEGAFDAIKGAANVVLHPIETAQGIYNLATHPAETWQAIKNGVKETIEVFKSGDPEKISNFLGKGLGNLLGGYGIGKAVSTIGKLAKGLKVAKAITRAVEEEAAARQAIDNAWNADVALEKNSHHIMPKSIKNEQAYKDMRKGGFKYDGNDNRVDVPKNSSRTNDLFHAKHPNYTEQVKRYLQRLNQNPKWGTMTDLEKANYGRNFNSWLTNEIKYNTYGKGIKLNEVTLDFTTVPAL